MEHKESRRSWAEINLDHIAHNAREIRRFTHPDAEIMGVVKADAYGHGAVQVARTVLENGFTRLAVSMLDEGIELRNAGIRAPILILSDYEPECAELIAAYDLTPAVYSFAMAERLSEAAQRIGKKTKIHLKIDTGMGRIGFQPETAPEEAEKISRLPGIEIEGIFTHFAVADEYGAADLSYTENQYRLFYETCEKIEREKHIHIPLRHAANSAAILRFPHMHLNLVRAGIILYGLLPSAETERCGAELRPAMTLKSVISHLKTVPAGTCISYGCTYRTEGPTVIATVPIGYADGYPRLLGNRAEAFLEAVGLRVPVIGRVCMDQLMLDVTAAGNTVQLGDTVVLFGEKYDKMPTADEIASRLGTINYEVTCGISRRVPRVYLSGGTATETVNRLR